ncbi:MAG: TIGR02270 family protein [Enhygromyxa sp.]
MSRPRGFSPAALSSLVHEGIVAEHVDEIAHLWTLREIAIAAPHYALEDIAELDERLEANLEGLVFAGPRGLELAGEALEYGEGGELFCITALAIALCDSEGFEAAARQASDPESGHAVVAAMSWLPFEFVEAQAEQLSRSSDPVLAAVGLATCANHRQDRIGERLGNLCFAADQPLRARALRAVGELGRADLLDVLAQAGSLPDEDSRFAAAWSKMRLGQRDPETIRALWAWIEAGSAHADSAAMLAARSLAPAVAESWYQHLRTSPAHHRWAIEIAAQLGDPAAVDDLIAWSSVPELARRAGQALTLITGVDLDYEDLDGEAPEGFETGPTDDPADERVELDPEENMPWPDPSLVAAWWESNRARFTPGTRYLGGRRLSLPSCWTTLRLDRQPLRRAAALELGLAAPSTPVFEVRAPAPRQLRQLSQGVS